MHRRTFPLVLDRKEGNKGKVKGKKPCSPITLITGRSPLTTNLKAKVECRACGRKGQWANHLECTMSATASSSQSATRTARMTVQACPSSQTSESKTCFVLFDDGDGPTAYMARKEVPLPAPSRQTLLTREQRIPQLLTEQWMTMTTPGLKKQTTDTAGASSSRWIPISVLLRDYPKQNSSLTKSKKVPELMSEFLHWAQKHYRIDPATSTLEPKQPEPSSHVVCMEGRKEFSRKGSAARFIQTTCKKCGALRSEERERDVIHNRIPSVVLIDTRTTEVAMRISGRHIASIAEHTSILFHAKFTTNADGLVRVHRRPQLAKKPSGIAY